MCAACRGKGWLAYDVPPGHPAFGKLRPCVCTQAGRLAQQRAALSGGKLAAMTVDTFKPLTADERAALRMAKAAAKSFAGAKPLSLILYAPLQDALASFPGHAKALHVTGTGCGKTHLAVGLAKAALDAGRSAVVTTESEFVGRIRATYQDGAPLSQEAVVAELAAAWLLVLDDVGTAYVKAESLGWYQDLLFQVVNQRYTAGWPLILTTNLPPAQLAERLGPRAMSRLNELAETCRLDGPDRREWAR